MRRLAGPVLLGLGVFLLVLAAASPTYIADRLIRVPLDHYTRTVAPGPGTYFDVGTLTERSGDLVATRTLRGDVAASTADRGVWDVSVVLQTPGSDEVIRGSVDRVGFDRKTGESVQWGGEAVDGEMAQHEGYTYKFPFDTEKQDYSFWDVNSRRSYPARYVTEEKVQGLTVYKFIQEIEGQQLRVEEVPGSLVGETEESFDAPVWYENTRTVWVEPKSGVIVKGNEQTKTTLRDSEGQDQVIVVEADLTFDEATQRSQAEVARDGRRQIDLIRIWLPLGATVLGVVLLLLGARLLRRRRPASEDRVGAPQPEPTQPPAATSA